jgi:hypothetical protein
LRKTSELSQGLEPIPDAEQLEPAVSTEAVNPSGQHPYLEVKQAATGVFLGQLEPAESTLLVLPSEQQPNSEEKQAVESGALGL